MPFKGTSYRGRPAGCPGGRRSAEATADARNPKPPGVRLCAGEDTGVAQERAPLLPGFGFGRAAVAADKRLNTTPQSPDRRDLGGHPPADLKSPSEPFVL